MIDAEGRHIASQAPDTFLKAVAGVLLVLAVPAAAQPVRYQETRAAMGTQFTIVVYGPDESPLQAAVSAAFDEILRIDRHWSTYLPDSDISVVNRGASQRPVPVDAELFGMLRTCLRFSRETEGAFDVTVGPLVAAWGFFKREGRIPSKKEAARALAQTGWRNVRLDGTTVSFAVPGMRLDLGAIGKGYAVDKAAAVLRQAGIQSALLDAGNSSILAIGAPPGQQGWTLMIRDPKDPKKNVEQVLLKDASLSTSGNYEKFFRVKGRTYSHIFDPRTGYPVEGVLSTSVIALTATETDALSTAFFVLRQEGTRRYLQAHPGIRVFFCGNEGCAWLR